MIKDELREINLSLYHKIDLSESDLKSLIDKNIVNTFGILEAHKIMYSIKKENFKIYKLKTYKRFFKKILTSIILISKDDIRIKSHFV